MDFDSIYNYCLSKPGTEETFPFDEHTLVFKVMGKMFAVMGLERSPRSINLKCDPDRSVELRELHPDIQPGWHMNKIHWNTVLLEGELEDALVYELVDHSYELVVKKLSKKVQAELKELS